MTCPPGAARRCVDNPSRVTEPGQTPDREVRSCLTNSQLRTGPGRSPSAWTRTSAGYRSELAHRRHAREVGMSDIDDLNEHSG